jgi:putative ABC transport system permease protein
MVAPRRFYMILLSVFAVVAVTLASVGVYSLMSYSVTRRTHEIGIRMALGAQPRDVIGIFFRQGVKLSVTGVVIGTAGAFTLTRLMRSLLYQVSPTDPLIFLGVAVFIGALVLLAGYIPARNATGVDPTVALRKE